MNCLVCPLPQPKSFRSLRRTSSQDFPKVYPPNGLDPWEQVLEPASPFTGAAPRGGAAPPSFQPCPPLSTSPMIFLFCPLPHPKSFLSLRRTISKDFQKFSPPNGLDPWKQFLEPPLQFLSCS